MKPNPLVLAAFLVILLLSACKRDIATRPEIQKEITAMQGDGWQYLEMIGEARKDPIAREIRQSDASGSLTVYAMSTGVDGDGSPVKEWQKTFKSDGFDFLEVKSMTSPASGYSLVFRRPQHTNEKP